MSKGNGKLNGSGHYEPEGAGSGTPDDLQDGKMVLMNVVQFMQGLAQALEQTMRHQAVHCKQIADLAAEVEALKGERASNKAGEVHG